MPCDTKLKPRQTLTQRKAEITKATAAVDSMLAARTATISINPATGAIVFLGIIGVADGMTDACIYRRLMATGSASARMAIARAEALAGRPISKQAVAAGLHSHDGGTTWHTKG